MSSDKFLETYPWEPSLRELCLQRGVRKKKDGLYEASVAVKGKTMFCGCYPSECLARKAVCDAKTLQFIAGVIGNGDNPLEVVESVERGYFASPNGHIYNRHGEVMRGAIDHCGYRHSIFNKRNRNIHRIIAETFLPNPYNLPCVNHKDGNKLNNSVSNLEWCTHSDNTKHAFENGLEFPQRGENNPIHKLTEDDVRYIKSVYIKNHRQYGATALAAQFNVDRTTVGDIVRGKSWRHIQ